MSNPPSHVGAFIVRKNEFGYEVLLTKRDQKQEKFFLPAGHIREGEPEILELKRITADETGLEGTAPLADLGKISRPGRDDAGQKYVKTIRYYLFLLKQVAGPPEWQKTAEEGKVFFCFWKNLDEFNDLIHFPQEKQLGAIAQRFLPTLPGLMINK